MANPSPTIVKYEGPIATITLNRPDKLNALMSQVAFGDYDALADAFTEINKRPDVLVTVWQANGRWFCPGTNVSGDGNKGDDALDPNRTKNARRRALMTNSQVADVSRAMYTHTKILVAVLNGPALGIGAAFLGHFDFIYATPGAWLALPFGALGLTPEVNSSITYPRRMGFSKANEVLLFGRKHTVEDLLPTGFVNKIFPPSPSAKTHDEIAKDLHAQVYAYLLDLIEPLDPSALLASKAIIKQGLIEQNNPDAVNVREATATINQFIEGVPSQRFGEIARKERRHKL